MYRLAPLICPHAHKNVVYKCIILIFFIGFPQVLSTLFKTFS